MLPSAGDGGTDMLGSEVASVMMEVCAVEVKVVRVLWCDEMWKTDGQRTTIDDH